MKKITLKITEAELDTIQDALVEFNDLLPTSYPKQTNSIRPIINSLLEKILPLQLRQRELERVFVGKNKCMGTCECCDQYTVLVKDIGMCGPCTFGESETLNGNW